MMEAVYATKKKEKKIVDICADSFQSILLTAIALILLFKASLNMMCI